MSPLQKRTRWIVTLVLCQGILTAAPAHAGPFLDWLFGRRPAYYVPTGTYMPTAAGAPVTAGYMPTTQTAYSLPTATAYSLPKTTAYAVPTTPVAYPTPTTVYSLPTTTQPALPVMSPQANRTAYALPPTTSRAVTAYSPVVPGNSYYQAGAPYYWPSEPRRSFFGSWFSRLSSYYGSGNYYPSHTPYPGNSWTGSYWSSYRLPGYLNGGSQPAMPAPTAAYSPVTSYSPLNTAAQSPGLFNPTTAYGTNTYNAPVTYYRPVQTIDPTTGLQTTSMQACQSSQTQVQRIPTTSFFGGNASTGCQPGMNCGPAYGTTQYAPNGTPAYTNQPAVTVPGSMTQRPTFNSNGYVSPAPSATYDSGTYPVPTTPMNPSYPSVNGAAVPANGTGDAAPVAKPQLNSPTNTPSAYYSPSSPSPAYSLPSQGSGDIRSTTQRSQTNVSPRLDVRPVPAPSNQRFQFNTTEDRTANRLTQPTASQVRPQAPVLTANYKTIQWSQKTEPSVGIQRTQHEAPVKQHQYRESNWTAQ